jgi:hypothetical protein
VKTIEFKLEAGVVVRGDSGSNSLAGLVAALCTLSELECEQMGRRLPFRSRRQWTNEMGAVGLDRKFPAMTA